MKLCASKNNVFHVEQLIIINLDYNRLQKEEF